MNDFQFDLSQEAIITEAVLRDFVPYFKQNFGITLVQQTNMEEQKEGVDVIAYKNNKIVAHIDFKCQTSHIGGEGRRKPLDSFAFELFATISKNIGWFLNDQKTTYYITIWIDKAKCKKIHNRDVIEKADDIREYNIMIISKKKLKRYLYELGITDDLLLKIAKRIPTRLDLLDKHEKPSKWNKNKNIYHIPFDRKLRKFVYHDQYNGDSETIRITYSKISRGAKPVNLVIPKSILKSLANACYTVEKGQISAHEKIC